MLRCFLYWYNQDRAMRLGAVEFHVPPRIGEAITSGHRRDDWAAAVGMDNPADAREWRIDDIRHNVGDDTVSVYVVPIMQVTG